MHDLFGVSNKQSPCMMNNVFTMHFPKQFVERTCIREDSYPVYRRKDDGKRVDKKDVPLHNRYIYIYSLNISSFIVTNIFSHMRCLYIF